jgi:nucleotide-binding universal stress UspA family protein
MISRTMTQEQYSGRAVDTTSQIGLKNILFATDLSSAADNALPYAIEIAHRYSATLFAVHIFGPPVYPYAAADDWPKLAEDDESIRLQSKLALDARLLAVPHELIFETGKVWETISRIIAEKKIDMLVLGTRGRTGIEKALMGSVAEEIFRQSVCPVLTVGPHVTVKSRNAAQLSHILYATDFSSESLAAAPYAISLAREHRARLILLNCMEECGDVRSMLHTLRELVPFGTDLRCDPTCVVQRGAHEEKIMDVAESHGADMIVLGVSAADRDPSKKAHLQSSALYRIVTQSICPVLTVRA